MKWILSILAIAVAFHTNAQVSADTLTFVRPLSDYIRSDGEHRVNLIVKGPSGRQYVIEVAWEQWEGLKPGDVVIRPRQNSILE